MSASSRTTPANQAGATATPRPNLRGDIEGLRTIAVMVVMLYHLGFERLSGGFAGVDIFFVISGFLICSHLMKEADRTGKIDLITFYARRARRLLPAATVVLVFTALVGFVVVPRVEFENLAMDIASAALYFVNWTLAWRAVDYLAEDARPSPVQHYWSLSVEEQFYIVVPIIMLILAWAAVKAKISPRVIITTAVILITLVSFIYSVTHTAASPQTAYFVTTTRVWELGIGAIVAGFVPLLRKMSHTIAAVLAGAGLVILVISLFVIDTTMPWPSWTAAMPVVSTAMIIAAGCATADTVVGRVLGIAPMRWIGGLSYSIYLWHWPLIVLSSYKWPDMTLTKQAILFVLSILLAWASKVFIEDPVRFGRGVSTSNVIALGMGAVGMGVSLATAGILFAHVPNQNERPASAVGGLALVSPEEQRANGAAVPKVRKDPDAAVTVSGTVYPDPLLAQRDVPAYYDDECQASEEQTDLLDCVYGKDGADKRVALVGDSKAGQWFPTFEKIAQTEGWSLELYLKSACQFSSAERKSYPKCNQWNENVMKKLEKDAPDVVIVSGLANRPDDFPKSTKVDKSLAEGYVDYLGRLADAGSKVVFLADNPTPVLEEMSQGGSVYECVAESSSDFSGCGFTTNEGVGTKTLEKAYEDLSKGKTGDQVSWLDPNEFICPTELDECPAAIGEVLVYRQGSHITATYADSLTPIVHRMLIKNGVAKADPLPMMTGATAEPTDGE